MPVYEEKDKIFAYYRQNEMQKILIAANYGEEACTLKLESPAKKILLSNFAEPQVQGDKIILTSAEVAVIEL